MQKCDHYEYTEMCERGAWLTDTAHCGLWHHERLLRHEEFSPDNASVHLLRLLYETVSENKKRLCNRKKEAQR